MTPAADGEGPGSVADDFGAKATHGYRGHLPDSARSCQRFTFFERKVRSRILAKRFRLGVEDCFDGLFEQSGNVEGER